MTSAQFRQRILWPGLLLLVLLGVAAALIRGVAVATGFSATTAWFQGLLTETDLRDVEYAERWYASVPLLTLVHVGAGLVFLALAPFQLSRGLRARRPRGHRITGRLVLVAAIPTAVSGLILAWRSPLGTLSADAAIYLFGFLFLGSMVMAYRAIRRGDVARHREWMIRMIAIGAGIATVRLVSLPLMAFTDRPPLTLLATSFWVGLGSTFAVAEVWIRRADGRTGGRAGGRKDGKAEGRKD